MEGSVLGMLAALGFFLLFQLCGILCAGTLLKREHAGVYLLSGSVLGSVMLMWFPALFSFFLGFSLPAHLLGGLAAVMAAGGALFLRRQNSREDGPFREAPQKLLRRRGFLLFLFATWLFFCFLVWHSLRCEDGAVFSSQATYGDTNMHLGFITSIANQQMFPPEYSILPGTPLSYPFLSDSISSSLYLLGAPLRFAYMLPMWVAGGQVFLGFYLAALRLLRGHGGKAALAFVFFFFNGGFGVFYFLGSRESFRRIFTEFYETPTNLIGNDIRWVNVIVDMMLPQRATLFGWAVLFSLLYLLYRAVWDGEKRYFLYAGILAGTLPMIHTHSFLAFAVVCGAWLLFWLLRRLSLDRRATVFLKYCMAGGIFLLCGIKALLNRQGTRESPYFLLFIVGLLALCAGFVLVMAMVVSRRDGAFSLFSTWGVLLLFTLALALPQLFTWTFRQAGGTAGFVRGYFGWCMGEDNYLWFYLKNIGIVGVLALCGLLLAGREKLAKYSPALFLWLLAEFVVFQPNEYDNNKLLYVAFFFLCCAAGDITYELLEKMKNKCVRTGIAVCLAACCSVSAVLTMGRETVASYRLYDSGALGLCQYIEDTLPPDAVVLTDTRHNNEIAALTGRNIVCGSPSFLYFHGLDFSQQERAARLIYETPEAACGLLELYRVDYILVSDYEMNSYAVDVPAIEKLYPCVYSDGIRSLYQVTKEENP